MYKISGTGGGNMNRSFKEIREEYIETCKKLIESEGDCKDIPCYDCPFNTYNLVGNYSHCGDFIHPNNSVYYGVEAICRYRVVRAREFLLLTNR